jgi:type II restriction/modification system DNA methylase subunit YeeA
MHIQPRKALNKAFLKIKPNRDGIELFKNNLKLLLDKIKLIDSRPKDETEEHLKNDLRDFLRDTYYKESNAINTKDKKDLVIHHGKNTNSNVAIIIEAKRPSNKSEMFSVDNVNCKALQELILYFLRERISNKNLSITNLIITNVTKWFLFEAQLFDKLFAQNKSLVKQFEDFEAGKLSGKNTDFFYKEIAKPFIETLIDKLEYTYFDLATYDKILRNDDKQDDAKLIVLYKLLSPEHLLKLSFANDNNSLDKNFYNELLHLIGLTETKEGGKKLIERPKSGQRHAGSLLENVINQLDSLDKISRLPNVKQYGNTHEERLFTVGLELCITWVNRILFLKLLEAQLISYHKGDKSYAFLHKDLLHDYDNLNALFFMVLAKKPEERNDRVKTPFAKVPYLNSSLFEPTDLEHQALLISSLENGISLPFISATVIKDANGKKLTGERNAIDYFFDFLDAYDFASEGSEDIQEDNKTLINASVLGLIFEKINGYKDGSFYTPSFITMYMCKETIRRAVVQKFNETKGWNCEDFDALYNKIDDTQEANAIINSVKICDPAVGSGHFLVSALNEMIAIKHDLKVLTDREGKRLKEYQVDIVNDELIVTDEDGVPFTYNPKSKESQRLQETLFHEKQTIIENCLFGVDINPNSVKICRLRLWIELLKNAYYRNETELETLPNIDINIKCGNSLIARFGLDADLKEALQKSKLKIDDYKRAVDQYRNAESKEQKREMELLIAEIKTGFSSNIDNPFKDKIKKARWEVNKYETEINTKEQWGDKIEKSLLKEFDIAKKKFQKLEDEQEEIKSNKIYENAFEWRFEFPEVLNDEGDFVGFDVVIGNPPYIRVQNLESKEVDFYFNNFITPTGKLDISILFFEKALKILSKNGYASYISSSQWTQTDYGKEIRSLLSNGSLHKLIDFGSLPVFEEADTYPAIFNFGNSASNKLLFFQIQLKDNLTYDFLNSINFNEKSFELLSNESWNFSEIDLINHLTLKNIPYKLLKEIATSYIGLLTGMDKAFVVKNEDVNLQKLEKELLLPYGYRGEEIKPFSEVKPNSMVIYPYKFNANGSEELISENELETKFPNIYNQLQKHKLELTNRKDSRKLYASGNEWYKHLRKGGFNLIIPKKLLVKGVTTKMTVGILYENSAFNGANCPAIILNDKSFNEFFFLGILNSKLISFFMNSICPKKLGGYYRYNANNISKIPIVIPETESVNEISKKVDQILSLKKASSKADTTALEREIDFIVYTLYGLSEEEIGIVEES